MAHAGMDDYDVVFNPEDQAICVVNADAPQSETKGKQIRRAVPSWLEAHYADVI